MAGRGQKGDTLGSRLVLATGLGGKVTKGDIESYFGLCGNIEHVVQNREDGSAVICFASSSAIQTALCLDNGIIGYTPIRVSVFNPSQHPRLAAELSQITRDPSILANLSVPTTIPAAASASSTSSSSSTSNGSPKSNATTSKSSASSTVSSSNPISPRSTASSSNVSSSNPTSPRSAQSAATSSVSPRSAASTQTPAASGQIPPLPQRRHDPKEGSSGSATSSSPIQTTTPSTTTSTSTSTATLSAASTSAMPTTTDGTGFDSSKLTSDDCKDGLLVTALPKTTTLAHLKELFAFCGHLRDIALYGSPQRPEYKAIILFSKESEAVAASRLDGVVLLNKCIRVEQLGLSDLKRLSDLGLIASESFPRPIPEAKEELKMPEKEASPKAGGGGWGWGWGWFSKKEGDEAKPSEVKDAKVEGEQQRKGTDERVDDKQQGAAKEVVATKQDGDAAKSAGMTASSAPLRVEVVAEHAPIPTLTTPTTSATSIPQPQGADAEQRLLEEQLKNDELLAQKLQREEEESAGAPSRSRSKSGSDTSALPSASAITTLPPPLPAGRPSSTYRSDSESQQPQVVSPRSARSPSVDEEEDGERYVETVHEEDEDEQGGGRRSSTRNQVVLDVENSVVNFRGRPVLFNFRDVADTYLLSANRRIRAGLVYRSAGWERGHHDAEGVQSALTFLLSRDIRTIIDLRASEEKNADPYHMLIEKHYPTERFTPMPASSYSSSLRTPQRRYSINMVNLGMRFNLFNNTSADMKWKVIKSALNFGQLTPATSSTVSSNSSASSSNAPTSSPSSSRLSKRRIMGAMKINREAASQLFLQEVMTPLGLFGMSKLLLNHAKQEIAMIFRILSDPQNHPVLIHCTSGKDRTGLVCALLQTLCQVDREEVITAYHLSEHYLRFVKHRIRRDHQSKGLDVAWDGTPRNVMHEVLDYINSVWGSVPVYLHEMCGFSYSEQDRLRQVLMTEDALRPGRRRSTTSDMMALSTIDTSSSSTSSTSSSLSSSTNDNRNEGRRLETGRSQTQSRGGSQIVTKAERASLMQSTPASMSSSAFAQSSMSYRPARYGEASTFEFFTPIHHQPSPASQPVMVAAPPPLPPRSYASSNNSPTSQMQQQPLDTSPRSTTTTTATQLQRPHVLHPSLSSPALLPTATAAAPEMTPLGPEEAFTNSVLVEPFPDASTSADLAMFFSFCGPIYFISINRFESTAVVTFRQHAGRDSAVLADHGFLSDRPVRVRPFHSSQHPNLTQDLLNFIRLQSVSAPPPLPRRPSMYQPNLSTTMTTATNSPAAGQSPFALAPVVVDATAAAAISSASASASASIPDFPPSPYYSSSPSRHSEPMTNAAAAVASSSSNRTTSTSLLDEEVSPSSHSTQQGFVDTTASTTSTTGAESSTSSSSDSGQRQSGRPARAQSLQQLFDLRIPQHVPPAANESERKNDEVTGELHREKSNQDAISEEQMPHASSGSPKEPGDNLLLDWDIPPQPASTTTTTTTESNATEQAIPIVTSSSREGFTVAPSSPSPSSILDEDSPRLSSLSSPIDQTDP